MLHFGWLKGTDAGKHPAGRRPFDVGATIRFISQSPDLFVFGRCARSIYAPCAYDIFWMLGLKPECGLTFAF
ncbi:hypothetical protein RTM1035_01225 [Roseovarius sp. TM1035]|nr:Hypothetical protein RAK1035_1617 [Roseovarius sp. AK1035]EDM31068.1 hypothetical protein RTM1035_01225 [Roseovarius sp. TM1035]